MKKVESLTENQKNRLKNRGFTKNTINAISKQSTIKNIVEGKNKEHQKFINEILYQDIILEFEFGDIIEYKYYSFENLLDYIKEIIGENQILSHIGLKENNRTYTIFHKKKKSNFYKNYGRQINKINKIKTGTILSIVYVPKFNAIELADFVLNGTDGPERINKLKPVGSFNNGSTMDTFYCNWLNYTNEEKNITKKIISDSLKLDIDIYFEDNKYTFFFYSVKYLTLLAHIFGFTLDEAFDILSVFRRNKTTPKQNDFIYICYGDLTGFGNEKQKNVSLTENGDIKMKIYLNTNI